MATLDKGRFQGIRQNFYCNYMYSKNSLSWNWVCPERIWLLMTCFCLCWKLKPWQEEKKLHAIPCFPAGSIAVHIRDHLQFRIICGPIWGSFPVWGSFVVGSHLRRCTLQTCTVPQMIPKANYPQTGNDPQIGPQMIPNHKWSLMLTSNDPTSKGGMAWSLVSWVFLFFYFIFIFIFIN